MPNLEPKHWEETMEPWEVRWCRDQIHKVLSQKTEDGYDLFMYADSFRAARMWKSSQMRRFRKARTCCGSHEWVVTRWSWRKLRFDKYLLGFNFGH